MKSLLGLLAMILCLGRLDAGSLALDGTLSWNVTEPECAFKLVGTMQNITGAETGTIRMVLWASRTTPPADTQIVGEYTLGQLPAGYQFTDFKVKIPPSLPTLDGAYNFTLGVLEFTTAGWRNQLLIPGGTRTLAGGHIVGQAKWKIPAKPVIDPPSRVRRGDTITLNSKATGLFNQFPSGWKEKTVLSAEADGAINISNSSRTAVVSYTYTVGNSKLKGKRRKTGKLILTFVTSGKTTYNDNVLLYFQSATSGTYKSVVTGSLWTGELDSSVTWGTFLFK